MSSPSAKQAPQRILVADDEHLMATGLSTSLASLGFDVVGPVADGAAAIELATTAVPDMALLDIRMPGTDGLAAARTLWEQMGIPSIIISAYSDGRYVEQARQTGVFGYLLKPVSTDTLRVTISVAWARAVGHDAQAKRINQLENNLAHRRTIEQAKWKLVETEGLTEAEAHARLQKAARDHRRRLVDVAAEVLGVSVAGERV